MIQVQIKDSYGNECSLNDLMIIHYKNENIKFVGILTFNQKELKFYISHKKESDYYPTTPDHKIERITGMQFNEREQIFLSLYGGRVEFMSKMKREIFKEDYKKLITKK